MSVFKPGDKVRHPKYPKCLVAQSRGEWTNPWGTVHDLDRIKPPQLVLLIRDPTGPRFYDMVNENDVIMGWAEPPPKRTMSAGYEKDPMVKKRDDIFRHIFGYDGWDEKTPLMTRIPNDIDYST